jgi:cell division protein FtsB
MIEHVISRARFHFRLTGRALVLLVLVGALLIASVYPLRTYLQQRSQIGSLQHRVEELQRRSAALDRRIVRLHDPRYLEFLARQCQSMVKKGEITFIIFPRKKGQLPKDC